MAAEPGPPAVELIGVSKRFGAVSAVRELSLAVRRGEVLTLLGPSGCGKTTLLNLIAGFETPDTGAIRLAGRDVTQSPPYLRDTGMVFQSYALFPHMNVFDNVAFGLRMRRRPKPEIAAAVGRALDMVKLQGFDQRQVRQLSGGQQQRVALARAIVVEPRVLLLDEPLSALDKNLREEMQVELKELHDKTGLTTVFVTHDQGEALSLSDRIAVIDKGEIQQISPPVELYEQPANGFVASFIGEINALPPARCTRHGGTIELQLDDGARLKAPLRRLPAIGDGERVRLFVRPEHVALAEPGSEAANRVPCRVLTHVYQGAHTLSRVEAGGLGVLRLRSPGGAVIERLPPGTASEVSIDLEQAVILPVSV